MQHREFITCLFIHGFSSNRTHVDLANSGTSIRKVQLADNQGQALQIIGEYTKPFHGS